MIKPYDIYQYGDFYPISKHINVSNVMKTLEIFEDKWSQYNTRRAHIPREGLCVFNYDGVCGPNPALDSLKQYNELHNTDLKETDAHVPTELYQYSSELQEYFKPLIGSVVRTHFLRLKPGGFFPPHRDHTKGKQTSFRIIVPIANCEPPYTNFILEDKILRMTHGTSYVINTTKEHTLFNANNNLDSIWLVINCKIDDRSLSFIESGL